MDHKDDGQEFDIGNAEVAENLHEAEKRHKRHGQCSNVGKKATPKRVQEKCCHFMHKKARSARGNVIEGIRKYLTAADYTEGIAITSIAKKGQWEIQNACQDEN